RPLDLDSLSWTCCPARGPVRTSPSQFSVIRTRLSRAAPASGRVGAGQSILFCCGPVGPVLLRLASAQGGLSMPSIPLELEEVGTVTVIRITGKRLLGQALVDEVSQSLLRLAGDPGRAHLLLDFHTVESLSSSMLAVLLSLRKALHAQGGRLALCGLRPELREAFGITGLEQDLNFHHNKQEALQSLR